MPTENYTVEAILSVKDQNFINSMKKASQAVDNLGDSAQQSTSKTSTFKDTMLGMASAIGVTSLIAKGFDMIKNSVSGALSRADTMANFTRSVTLFSGSANKASEALADLSSKTRGTAYGLDTAANSAKGLYTSGVELGKSVRYIGGWMDAVSTYGDGTNATLSGVTFQLAQMSAKGKANLGDLKSAMEAGIPVIKLYAEATGQGTQEVSDQISAGKISADEFLAVMDRAFREGTKSFKSIEGAAKKSGGTWRGTFDNMQAATTRGMLGIIEAIDDGLKRANLPDLKQQFANVGKTIESGFKLAAPVVKLVASNMDKLVFVSKVGIQVWAGWKIATTVTKYFDKLNASVKVSRTELAMMADTNGKLTSIAQAYTSMLSTQAGQEKIAAAAKKLNIDLNTQSADWYKKNINLSDAQKVALLAETGALSLKNIALGVLTGKIGLATVAQQAWNAAMTANPIGTVIVGATLLGNALGAVVGWLNQESPAHKKAQEAAKEQAEANKELTKSASDLSKKLKSTSDESSYNAKEARRLVDELEQLSKSTLDAERKQQRMAQVIGELNSKYPELNVALDETGTQLKGTTDAIYAQIKAMEASAKNKAMSDHLSELYKKQFELKTSIADTKDALVKMRKDGTDTQKFLGFLWDETSEGFRKLAESGQSMEKELTKVNALIEEANNQLQVTSEAEYNAKLAQEEHLKTLQALAENYGLTTDQIVSYSEKVGATVQEAGTKAVELSAQFGLSTDQIIAYADTYGLTLEQFAEAHGNNLKFAEEKITNYIDTTTSGFDELKQKTAISMDEYLANLEENTRATREWSDNVNILMKAGVSEGVIKELEKLGPAGAQQAQAFVAELQALNGGTLGEYDSLNESTKAKLKELEDAMSAGMEAAGEATKTSVKAQEYSKVGSGMGADIAKGIVDKQVEVNAKMKAMGESTKQNYLNGINGVDTEASRLGANTGAGFNNGLSGQAWRIFDTASWIANGVTGRIRSALEIRSPSRVMKKLGGYTGQGFAQGLKDSIPQMSAITAQIADTVQGIDTSLHSSYKSSGAHTSARAPKPAHLVLQIGGREFTAFVDDISTTQEKTVRLRTAYQGG